MMIALATDQVKLSGNDFRCTQAADTCGKKRAWYQKRTKHQANIVPKQYILQAS